MATTSAETPRLSDKDFRRLVGLIGETDTVELKLTVPEADHRAVISSLGLDPLDAQIRQVFFFDTPDLELDAAGVVVRARRVQGKGDDSVVKLRPVEPSKLPAEVRASPSFGVEVDAMPGGFVCSGSMKRALTKPIVRDTLLGKTPVRKLFSKEQRAFYAEHAPDGIAIDDLSVLGPIFVLKVRYVPEDFGRKFVAELWLYPDGRRILELSTKCLPGEAFDVAANARAFLLDRGVDLAGEQQTKTRTALEFFSRTLQEGDEES
jgi:hypothetical protein